MALAMLTDFQPEYIQAEELETYGLPSVDALPIAMAIVDAASSLIDAHCGRVDGNGCGSLVYSTYQQQLYLPPDRNVIRLAFTPLVGLDQGTADTLSAMDASGESEGTSTFYTGFTPSTVRDKSGNVSSLISASGRYGYGRRDNQYTTPDLGIGASILQLIAPLGGPPSWVAIDCSAIDVKAELGELWLPAGLYLTAYTEVDITYNAGYDPRHLPRGIKHSCAALCKNFISRAGGITGLKGYTAGKVHATFTEDLIDRNIEKFLSPFCKVGVM